MMGALVEQGGEVYRLDSELHGITGQQNLVSVTGDRGARVRQVSVSRYSSQGSAEIPAGSYIIFLNQPYRQNVLALFEPQLYPDRMTATGEAERPYDVAGWTLPMMMGVESPAVLSIREVANERKLTLIKGENDVRRDLGLPLWTSDKSPIANPIKPGVRVGIYQGARGNMDEGWTRYVFDTFNAPYQTLRDPAINETNLRTNYDAIVLPSDRSREPADSGSAAAEGGAGISDKGFVNLARFVEDGGTLICFDGSCGSLIRRWKLPLRSVLEGLSSSDFYCPGSILRIDVDTSNPIARTMSKETDAYFINSSAFEPAAVPESGMKDVAASLATGPAKIIAHYAVAGVLRSGWLLGEGNSQGRGAVAEVPGANGRIVLFGFRPQHRGQTWGTFPFIWNAINSGH